MGVVLKDAANAEIYTYGHTLALHDALPIAGGPQKEAAGPDGLANVVTLDSATYDDRSAEMEHDQMGASSRNLGGERLLALFRDEHGTPAEIAARPVDAVLGPQDDAMRVALEKRPCWHCHVQILFPPEPACSRWGCDGVAPMSAFKIGRAHV